MRSQLMIKIWGKGRKWRRTSPESNFFLGCPSLLPLTRKPSEWPGNGLKIKGAHPAIKAYVLDLGFLLQNIGGILQYSVGLTLSAENLPSRAGFPTDKNSNGFSGRRIGHHLLPFFLFEVCGKISDGKSPQAVCCVCS